jgi:uncharacterized protein YbaR (Trm112 family)
LDVITSKVQVQPERLSGIVYFFGPKTVNSFVLKLKTEELVYIENGVGSAVCLPECNYKLSTGDKMTWEQFSYMALGVLLAFGFGAVFRQVDRTINRPKTKVRACSHKHLYCQDCRHVFQLKDR